MNGMCEWCRRQDDDEESALVAHNISNRQTGERIGIEVCRWPQRMRAELAFFKSADPAYVEYTDNVVTFRVMNGWATYTVENPYSNIGILNLTLGEHELRPRVIA